MSDIREVDRKLAEHIGRHCITPIGFIKPNQAGEVIAEALAPEREASKKLAEALARIATLRLRDDQHSLEGWTQSKTIAREALAEWETK